MESGHSRLSASRRTVVKAAWAAPVITTISAAPAFASTGLTLSIGSVTGARTTSNTRLKVTVAGIALAGTGSVGAQTANVTVPGVNSGLFGWRYPKVVTTNTTDWVAAGSTNNTSAHTTTFTFTRAASLAGGTSTSLAFTVQIGSLGILSFASSGTLSATVSASGVAPASKVGGW